MKLNFCKCQYQKMADYSSRFSEYLVFFRTWKTSQLPTTVPSIRSSTLPTNVSFGSGKIFECIFIFYSSICFIVTFIHTGVDGSRYH